MSLFASMNVAHTGMNAADTSISVIGNNLANANTVGFKSQRADFETIFARYWSLGSSPSMPFTAGSNPIQIGQGVLTMGTSTDFSQGSIKPGMTKTDMAISGDGFFITQPTLGSVMQYYTRNGVMKLNEDQQLVSSMGGYVMGYTVNDRFEIQKGQLSPITIAVGKTKIAEATRTATIEGLLNAVGPDSTQGTVLESKPLTDLSKTSPGAQAATASVAAKPSIEAARTSGTASSGSGEIEEGTYLYRFVYSRPESGFDDETDYSSPLSVTVSAGQNMINLIDLPIGQLPEDAEPPYTHLKIYRAVSPDDPQETPEFHLVDEITATTTSYTDTLSTETIAEHEEMNLARLQGGYQYYVTFADDQGNESRPSYISNTMNVNGGRISLSDIPMIGMNGNPDNWTQRKIYRCSADNPTDFYLVTTLHSTDAPVTYVDGLSDADLIQQEKMSFEGKGNVLANGNTALVNIGVHDDQGRFVNVFTEGTLQFTGNKGGNDLKTETLTIDSTTTLQSYMTFLSKSFGIRTGGENPDIPRDQGDVGKTINDGSPGVSMVNGKITILGNTGTQNELRIIPSQMTITDTTGNIKQLGLDWSRTQDNIGDGISTSLLVFDSLGTPVNVHLTMTLESKGDTETLYRWYADSVDNQAADGISIAVGTGTVKFDSNGKLIGNPTPTVTIERIDVASQSPMKFDFNMDLGAVAALATSNQSLSMIRQDGAGAGVLYDYTVADDGIIYGTFTSGAVRPLGQVLLAHFVNNEGLVQVGDNLFIEGVNSGQAQIGEPNQGIFGKIKGQSIEMANTDIANELIDMIMASSTYRANAKVITAANDMFEAVLRIV